MKIRKFKIGDPVLHNDQPTIIRGYHRDSPNLFVVESNAGWFGWCILESQDLMPDNQVVGGNKYILATTNELKNVSRRVLAKSA